VTDVWKQTVTYTIYIQILYVTIQRVLLDFITMAVMHECVYILPFNEKLHVAKSIEDDSLMMAENVSRDM
jgi:hypothetical protein